MSRRLSDQEIDYIFIISDDEDVINDLDDVVLNLSISSDDETDSEDGDGPPPAQRPRKERGSRELKI